ncbi:MAG: hypothetical protein QM786_11630 [Breznakibacter sp.]
MVIENFYTFNIDSVEKDQIRASVSFNQNNPVYKGHFPQVPVTPGVCQILVIKELLAGVLGTQLQLVKAREIKFLSMHNPVGSRPLDILIKYEMADAAVIGVNALISDNERKILKLNGEFKPK